MRWVLNSVCYKINVQWAYISLSSSASEHKQQLSRCPFGVAPCLWDFLGAEKFRRPLAVCVELSTNEAEADRCSSRAQIIEEKELCKTKKREKRAKTSLKAVLQELEEEKHISTELRDLLAVYDGTCIILWAKHMYHLQKYQIENLTSTCRIIMSMMAIKFKLFYQVHIALDY